MEVQVEEKTCVSTKRYGQDTVALPEETGRNGENKRCPKARSVKQAGEIHERWEWIETTVWTERMLTALEKGVKGNVWFSLIDKVYDKRNLELAARKVLVNKGSAGVDNITTGKYAQNLEDNLERIHQSLKDGSYKVQEIKRIYIPKAGGKEKRPLGIPTVRDRIVQAAVKQVIEPIFENEFSENSFGFRPQRGTKDALREVDKLLKNGYEIVVDADIKSYFDTISHDRLMDEIKEKIADSRVLGLIEQLLKQGVMEGLKYWEPEEGTPQGGVLSPLLANIYLDKLDSEMKKEGYTMIRYADDFLVMCQSEEEAVRALNKIKEWMEEVGLKLHPTKTKIVDMRKREEGFDFLGYHFERTKRTGKIKRWPAPKSLRKMKDSIRQKTKRCNGKSIEDIVANINRQLRGWYEYYKHSTKWTFIPLDKWIRMRLRSILRKRKGGHGRGRGKDHYRWPNRYFEKLGLFSLTTAYMREVLVLR